MSNIPVLFITFNRLNYTKISLKYLLESGCNNIIIIDNNSTDGTVEWLNGINDRKIKKIIFNKSNLGVARAMNQFIKICSSYTLLAKVDNDTLVPLDWLVYLESAMNVVDIVQAKHPILKETYVLGFDEWMKTKKFLGSGLYESRTVGGSGILFKRIMINEIPITDWILGGWNEWQYKHKEVKKAFSINVEVKLLDMYENGEPNYSEYEDYYKKTGRIK